MEEMKGEEVEMVKKWSRAVTTHDSPMDLAAGLFTWQDPIRIAQALKKSALDPKRKSKDPYRSAMSMLCFYMNRAGKDLGPQQKKILEKTKIELRKLFGRR